MAENQENVFPYVRSLILGLGAGLCIVVYLWAPIPENKYGALLKTLLSSGASVLLFGLIVYLLWYKTGQTVDQKLDQLRVAVQRDSSEINSISRSLTKGVPIERYPAVLEFQESFRNIDWEEKLRSANHSLDIVVYYFDSWVNTNYESLVIFFRKPRTKLRLIVSDPRREDIVDNIHRLFPEYPREQVRTKVEMTAQRLRDALHEAGAAPDRLEVFFAPFLLSYSAQCIDSRIWVLSVYEMFRERKINSPAIVVDLGKSDHLQRYWEKELQGLLGKSEQIK